MNKDIRDIRICVVGAGFAGSLHLEKLSKLGCRIIGVCDKETEKAESAAARFNTKPFQNHQELLPLCDAAIVATDTSSHFEIASEFIREGKDVFIEKPLAKSYDEGKKIVENAKKKGVILQIGHIERFNSVYKSVREIISHPSFISSERLSPFPSRSIDTDVILDVMIHDLDTIASVLPNLSVKRVEAIGIPIITDKIDIANVRIEFSSGCIAILTSSRVSYKKVRKFRIFQPDMYISMNFLERQVEIYKRTRNGKSFEISGSVKTFTNGDPIEEEITEFLNCIVERKRPEVSGDEALKSLELADKIKESIITLPENLTG